MEIFAGRPAVGQDLGRPVANPEIGFVKISIFKRGASDARILNAEYIFNCSEVRTLEIFAGRPAVGQHLGRPVANPEIGFVKNLTI